MPTALRASLQTFDCAGISDNMEGEYELRTGYARLDELRTNGASGAGAGVPLKFNIAGAVELLAPGNLVVQGTFDVEPTVIGRDAEENDCRGTEDDLGAPVLQGEVHTVFDYKRAFEPQFTDCEADVVYEHVLPTANHNGCPSCSVVGTVRPRRIAGDCEIDTDTLEMGLDVVSGRLWTWDDRLREWTNTSTGTVGYRQYGASFKEETNRFVRNDTITMTW